MDRARGELLAQRERDWEWFEDKPDRGLLVRQMTDPERAEYRFLRSPEWKGVSIIARCGDCGSRYAHHTIGRAAVVEPRLYMGDDELLASLDEPTGRFFRFISEPTSRIFRCGRCGSGSGNG
jgi:hypothetical protein